MYLVDTNVWLERLLDQERAEDIRRFLDETPSERLFITDFAFHPIGVVMSKLNRMEALLRFVQDAFMDGAVALVHLKPEETQRIASVIKHFNLDFDDGYPYLGGGENDLSTIIF